MKHFACKSNIGYIKKPIQHHCSHMIHGEKCAGITAVDRGWNEVLYLEDKLFMYLMLSLS